MWGARAGDGVVRWDREIELGVIVGECFVNSHTRGDDWTAC